MAPAAGNMDNGMMYLSLSGLRSNYEGESTSPLKKGAGTERGNQLHDITEELPREMPSPTLKRSASGEKLIPRYLSGRLWID